MVNRQHHPFWRLFRGLLQKDENFFITPSDEAMIAGTNRAIDRILCKDASKGDKDKLLK